MLFESLVCIFFAKFLAHSHVFIQAVFLACIQMSISETAFKKTQNINLKIELKRIIFLKQDLNRNFLKMM